MALDVSVLLVDLPLKIGFVCRQPPLNDLNGIYFGQLPYPRPWLQVLPLPDSVTGANLDTTSLL